MQDHPLRRELNDEVHARPFATLTAPLRATHLALLTGEGGVEAERRHLAALCAACGAPAPEPEAVHLQRDFGAFSLKWERHTEFSTYTFYTGAPEGPPFAASALDQVPADWRDGLPGERLVALQVELLARGAPAPDHKALAGIFGGEGFAGSAMTGGAAAAWMDFTIKPDGFGRLLIADRGLRPRQTGRLLQRLLELETYRMMALLALPAARAAGPRLGAAAARLLEITGRLPEIAELEDERRLLAELTRLSEEIERLAAGTGYRFAAARAYHALVQRRIAELREDRLEGLQTFGEFMERRLTPAMRTCEAVGERIDRLSRRLTRAGQLLRTRVDIELEAQNQAVLTRMDRRARLQLRLQETVEGLSVAAITYYVVGLVYYAAKALEAGGLPLDPDVAAGLAIPLVAGLVWLGVRRIRRQVTREGEAGTP